jgi:orotate phosphoribosyltransferase
MGGLVIGQEVARQLNKRYVFLEKVNDRLKLRRNFKFSPDEKVLIIEDVITKGGRVYEAIDEIRAHGGNPIAVGVIVDRSSGKTHFEIPHHSLAQLNFPTYEADKLPKELRNIPTSKPGS